MAIAAHIGPFLFAVFVWWFSTGAILWLDRQPKRTFRWSMAMATVALAVALVAVWYSAREATVSGAYVAFAAALAVWGWHELAFLMGYITGPRREPCPPDAIGWRRFRFGAATVIHHEIALAATALVIAALAWDQPNQVGTWTFLVLFGMRLSAKLNIFFGAPHFSDEMLPPALDYMRSYFRSGPATLLLPASIVAASATVAAFAGQAFAPDAPAYQVAGGTLLMGLAALGLLEHLFLALPVPDAALWRWAMPARSVSTAAPQAAQAKPATLAGSVE